MAAAYFALPHRLRWMLLLAGSYYFYMCWNASYALLMLFSTAVTYACGLLVGRAQSVKAKKGWVALSLCLNLSILFFFKYYGLFAGTLQSALGGSVRLPQLNVLLPVGISFYIFQALGYTIDVYRGDIAPMRHFGKYALFVSFFPQLVAGPIERSGNLIRQFDEKHRPDYEQIREGAVLILLGLVKKLVISDRLAVLVDKVYGDAAAWGAPAIIVATVCFAIQIYCDFSGYSDIAIGSAKLLGFRLMKNFDRPYFARSIAEFWRRWHISLSSWFRDYLYFPLGGSRVKTGRWVFNLMVVFLISGLWHGASWTFVAWGAINGLYQVIGRFTKTVRDSAYRALHVNPDPSGIPCYRVVTKDGRISDAFAFGGGDALAQYAGRAFPGFNLPDERLHQLAALGRLIFLIIEDVLRLFAGLGFLCLPGFALCDGFVQRPERFLQLRNARVVPVAAQQEGVQLKPLELIPQLQVFARGCALRLERLQAGFKLSDDILHAGEVLRGILQPSLGLDLARLVFDDAGGFFEYLPAFLRFDREDFVDAALTDQRIALLADAGIAEQIHDIAQTAGIAVDHVFAVAVAVYAPHDGHLGKVDGQGAVLIVDGEHDLAPGQLLALFGAAENNVLHLAAAQGFGALLAQYPANGVRYIGFAAAVRADDAGDALIKGHLHAVREGLEAVDFEFFQSQPFALPFSLL